MGWCYYIGSNNRLVTEAGTQQPHRMLKRAACCSLHYFSPEAHSRTTWQTSKPDSLDALTMAVSVCPPTQHTQWSSHGLSCTYVHHLDVCGGDVVTGLWSFFCSCVQYGITWSNLFEVYQPDESHLRGLPPKTKGQICCRSGCSCTTSFLLGYIWGGAYLYRGGETSCARALACGYHPLHPVQQ